MSKRNEKLEENIYEQLDSEILREKIEPESEDKDIFIEPKKEKKKKSYIVYNVSKIYVFYFNEGGYLTRIPNIWREIKIGETIYL